MSNHSSNPGKPGGPPSPPPDSKSATTPPIVFEGGVDEDLEDLFVDIEGSRREITLVPGTGQHPGMSLDEDGSGEDLEVIEMPDLSEISEMSEVPDVIEEHDANEPIEALPPLASPTRAAEPAGPAWQTNAQAQAQAQAQGRSTSGHAMPPHAPPPPHAPAPSPAVARSLTIEAEPEAEPEIDSEPESAASPDDSAPFFEMEALPSASRDVALWESAVLPVPAAEEPFAPSLRMPPPPRPTPADSPATPLAAAQGATAAATATTEATAAAPATRLAAPPPAVKTALNDNHTFRQESLALARSREWQKLAAMTSAAIDHASWVALPETRVALLGDLARIHRDRLNDPIGTESAFHRLALIDPGSDDALQYLNKVYRDRGDYRAVYDLYSAAVEPTWDPQKRLDWTRETAELATHRLASPDLAIEAWERLERLGDATLETYAALSEMYRRAGRWERLARFLQKRAAGLAGTERIVALREVGEAYLSGLGDHARAGEVFAELLTASPDDVVALVAEARVLEQRGDHEALAALATRALPGVPKKAVLDLRKVVAEALWNAKDEKRAVAVCEGVLALDPDDAEALAAKERYLEIGADPEELVAFLFGRAERATSDAARAELLARVARLADTRLDEPRRAVEYWEKCVAVAPPAGQLVAYQSLEKLFDRLGDLGGVARSLEGQLALTRKPGDRVPLLGRLGEHAAHRMGSEERAEACWKEIISIVPDDRATHDELLALHRRRGDFESVDRALGTQAWRAADAEGLALFRLAAKNVDENIENPRRAVAAWQRVLDLAPHDAAALGAQVAHRRTLGKPRDLIAALEAELRVSATAAGATGGGAERRARALEIAKLWEAEGEKVAALSAYERVLVWDPTDDTALAGLARLHTGAEVGAALAALEVAATVLGDRGDTAGRVALLRKALALTDRADALGRFYATRRILWLCGRPKEVLAELEKAAAAAGAWAELEAVYLTLAADTEDAGARASYRASLAALNEKQLQDPVRAFLVLQAGDRRPVDEGSALETLSRLGEATGRYEDLLALFEGAAAVEVPLARRQRMLRRRAAVCEDQLHDPARAFAEHARLLQLDASDGAALDSVARLAEKKGLFRALDALYAELADRATDAAARVAMAEKRHVVRRERLADPIGALDQQLFIYRLDPARPGLEPGLLAAADTEDEYDRVLPLVEARARTNGSPGTGGAHDSSEGLARLAGLHEHQREDSGRAFDLYAEAFLLKPGARELEEELARVAEAAGRHEELAAVLRMAAAHATDTARKLELYGRITRIPGEKRVAGDAALDAHRRILQLHPENLASLEVLIERHRANGEWRDLRDRLQQWVDHAPEAELGARASRLVEVAHLSRERLGDPEAALTAFARVLDSDPTSAEALEGVRSLTEGADSPRFELKRLHIELSRAEPARRVEIQLACARIERTQLDDADAAIATLRALVAETGADGPGEEPLAALYREKGDFTALVDLMEARAATLPDRAARTRALEEAVALCDGHAKATSLEQRERLDRKLLHEQPGDVVTRRRLLSLYREAGRHRDLAALLKDSLAIREGVADADERRQFEGELAAVLALALGDAAGAEAVLAAAAAESPSDPELVLGRARLSLVRGEFPAYLELRLAHAKKLPPAHAALVLCHLAEACDERPGQQVRVAGLYREVRALDPQNASAMEALKAIGRRAKSWRAQAALLPDADESTLNFAERAARLLAHGEAAAAEGQSARAADFYLRAVATDPDCHAAWDALAALRAKAGDSAAALAARRASLAAWERSSPPSPASLHEHAARIQSLAAAHRTEGEVEAAERLSLRAHRLAPRFAPAALAVADRHLDAGHIHAAYAIYDRVLLAALAPDPAAAPGDSATVAAARTGLGHAERLHATFRRGALAFRLGKKSESLADLEAALRLDPLHGGALQTLAEAYVDTGRFASAARRYIQALVVEYQASGRTSLYARLGRLDEDQLARPDEAGVCYDLALGAGPDGGAPEVPALVPDLMTRALHHYRRQGRPDRALAVIERILPATTEPRELSALWTERAAILGSSGDEERAVEAYDMALSYDPASRSAITGLSQILERRGDWEQLAQIFEARTETGSNEERAEALRALARMASLHLKDPARTERYLRAVVDILPTREDFEQLLAIYGDDPARFDERTRVLGGLLGLGGPYMPRLIELGKILVARGDRRWAWSVLSPLMNSTLAEPQLKATVLELRKEFEKSDNTTMLSPRTHALVLTPEAGGPLFDVVAELDNLCVLGRATLDEAGATGTGRLDERTAVGKSFAAVAARVGLEGTLLVRAQDLPEPFVVLDGPGEQRQAVVRADLLQLLSIAETGFLFSTMLESCRPGLRLIASLAPADRPHLVPALFVAAGVYGADSFTATTAPAIQRLAEKIRVGVPPETRAAWAETLAPLIPESEGPEYASALGARLHAGLLDTARRVGLVAAADLRFAARVVTRLDDTLPKMQTVGRIDDLDDFIAHCPPVRALVGFAVSPLFGQLIHGHEPA